jgi:hypothetical protein
MRVLPAALPMAAPTTAPPAAPIVPPLAVLLQLAHPKFIKARQRTRHTGINFFISLSFLFFIAAINL